MAHETASGRSVAVATQIHRSRRLSGLRRALLGVGVWAGMLAAFLLAVGMPAFGQENAPAAQNPNTGLVLARAGICESVENLNPVNTAAVFSVTQGQIYCFSDFGTVRSQTVVYHRWYHRDTLTTQIRLKIYPPRWATYSMLKLREVDKGPWKVEITDAEGRVLSVLRFSIVD